MTNYIKILGMGLLLTLISIIAGILTWIFSVPFTIVQLLAWNNILVVFVTGLIVFIASLLILGSIGTWLLKKFKRSVL